MLASSPPAPPAIVIQASPAFARAHRGDVLLCFFPPGARRYCRLTGYALFGPSPFPASSAGPSYPVLRFTPPRR